MNGASNRPLILRESSVSELDEYPITEEMRNAVESVTIPTNDAINNMTPVRDQGIQGACASFASVACLERIHRTDLSEAQIQHESEDNCQEGLPVIRAFRTCKRIGAVGEAVWPYDVSQVCWTDPPNTSGHRRYKFNDIATLYRRSRSTIGSGGNGRVTRIQRHMVGRRRPVCVSVAVWRKLWYTGEIEMPRESPPKEDGWHAVAICGWNGSKRRFTFKNSWGRDWGDAGYGTIPYGYVRRYSDTALIGW